MIHKYQFQRALIRALLTTCALVCFAATALAQPAHVVVPATGPQSTFLVFGDVRFTDPDSGSSNSRARRALVDAMARHKASFLVITGDLVRDGDNSQDWKIYDREMAPLRNAGTEVFPVLGNHDLHGDNRVALEAWSSACIHFVK